MSSGSEPFGDHVCKDFRDPFVHNLFLHFKSENVSEID